METKPFRHQTELRCRATTLHHSGVNVLTVRCVLRPRQPPDLDRVDLVFVARDGGDDRLHALRRVSHAGNAVFEGRVSLLAGDQPLLGAGEWDLYIAPHDGGGRVPLLAPAYGKGDWPKILVPAPAGPQWVSLSPRRGQLTARVRDAEPYVEVDRVEVDGSMLTIDAHAVPWPGHDRSEAQINIRRRGRDDAEVRLPLQLTAGRLRADVDLGALADDGVDPWDLYLRIGDGPELRLGSHLDEIRNKKHVFAFPRHVVERSGRRFALQPFYTAGNELSVRVLPVDAGSGRETGRAGSPEPAQRRSRGRLARASTGFLVSLVERLGRARRRRPAAERRKVYFLIHHAYGIGGVHRTVLNLAKHLAEDHDVEIISVFRTRRRPFYEIDPRVKVTFLLDEVALRGSPGRGFVHRLRRILHARPSWVVPENDDVFTRHSLWLDLKLMQRLHRMEPGVLIGTRVYLNLFAARFARPDVVTIGQEHLNFDVRTALLGPMRAHYPKLDALAALTEGDTEDFRGLLAGARTRVFLLPNALPDQPHVRADLDSKRVIAASHYNPKKGLDLLVAAFAEVVRAHPDWQLRIYGGGPLHGALQRQARELRLHNHVLLMGRTDQLSEEFARSSVFVLSSRIEGFGMVITEAMSVGLPVVSFDCPRGPSDIITDGVDGTLVPPTDVAALAAAICDLIEIPDKRRCYSEAGLKTARSYEIDAIGDRWRRAFDELLARA